MAIPISLNYDELMAKGDVLSSQASENIEPSEDPTTAVCNNFEHQWSLDWRRSKVNDISAYDYLRGTILT
ncbi:MAG: hypothetical protein IIB38_03070 [Candidatus Hydrogenedentes bacterium]|nr:hypothetical protein [Candidatus Hydrogenedentota bacterium]